MARQRALIGVSYDDAYAVEETFQLLKIPWEWYDPAHAYDVVIARKGDIDEGDAYLVDLSEKNYFAEIARILNEGIAHCHEPVVDNLIDELREILKAHTVLVEIPPVPGGYSYMIALTHDVDITSVKERRWISVGYAIYQCVRKGKVVDGLRILGAKCGIGRDPWNCFSEWMEIEKDLGVRSTFYFLPHPGRAGIGSPAIRAGNYDVDHDLIQDLVTGGWEVGVHGIDNWVDSEAARAEAEVLAGEKNNSGTAHAPGNRVHWLLFDPETWQILDDAGYSYDSTFGYNEDVGFRAGTLQAYKPRGTSELLELPLHIQDASLFGKHCWLPTESGCERGRCLNLDENEARQVCEEILSYAEQYGGVVTVLWHSECLCAPRNWGSLYQHVVKKSTHDNAWITRAIDIVDWFRMRRNASLTYIKKENQLDIHVSGLENKTNLPNLRVRIHIDPARVRHVDGEYLVGDDAIDIKCDREHITVVIA
ncbi:MAG: polysaccharide deacetylase family protein [Methanomicrobiales archaeon]